MKSNWSCVRVSAKSTEPCEKNVDIISRPRFSNLLSRPTETSPIVQQCGRLCMPSDTWHYLIGEFQWGGQMRHGCIARSTCVLRTTCSAGYDQRAAFPNWKLKCMLVDDQLQYFPSSTLPPCCCTAETCRKTPNGVARSATMIRWWQRPHLGVHAGLGWCSS